MTHWIAHVNPMNGEDENDFAYLSSKHFAEAAKVVGFEELNYARYGGVENPERRRKLFELLMAQVAPDDFVVVPFPLWMWRSRSYYKY